MNFDPETTKAASDGLSLLAKATSLAAAFVGGIVAATWAIACKVNGYDARISALEASHGKIDSKLDRIHARIDEVVIGHAPARHEQRGEADESKMG